MCFVCGLENPKGLHLAFYEDDGGSVVCQFTPPEEYQGYPGWLHGGITTALLDEVLGRAAIARDLWVATAKLEVRYRQPIPLGWPITIRGELTRVRSRVVEGRAEIHLADGTLAAEAEGVLVTISEEERARVEEILPFWQVVVDDA
jgi:acyl-coenzyme A thioesterase PaaI-like protein